MSSAHHKGIDDLLRDGGTPRVVPADEIDDRLDAIQREAESSAGGLCGTVKGGEVHDEP